MHEPSSTEPEADSAAHRHRTDGQLGRLRLLAGALLLAGLACLVLFLPSLAGRDGKTSLPEVSAPAATTAAVATAPAPSSAAPAPATSPTPEGPAAAAPQHLAYPAAGIDVVVHPLDPSAEDQERRTIIPPSTKDGYWLTPYGTPGAGSANTTYIVGHSWQDQDAPFNHLSTRAAAGDLLTVTTSTGQLAYRVESVTTYEKSSLKDSPIWAVAPNTVVLISCYTDDLWGTSVVVVATPA
jgi:hypothetical protein